MEAGVQSVHQRLGAVPDRMAPRRWSPGSGAAGLGEVKPDALAKQHLRPFQASRYLLAMLEKS